MKNLLFIILSIIVIIFLVLVSIMLSSKSESYVGGDSEAGVITFKNLQDGGVSAEFSSGEQLLDIKIEGGSMNLSIKRGDETYFEEEISEPKVIKVNLPVTGTYIVHCSGKGANGTISYVPNNLSGDRENEIFDILDSGLLSGNSFTISDVSKQ